MEKQKSFAQAYFEYQKEREKELEYEMLIDDRLRLTLPAYFGKNSTFILALNEELKQELKQELRQELKQEIKQSVREGLRTEPLNIQLKF